jgi:hypothetical protein
VLSVLMQTSITEFYVNVHFSYTFICSNINVSEAELKRIIYIIFLRKTIEWINTKHN